MSTKVKITSLNSIGANISHTTLVPVVNMTGMPETQKSTLQNVGNLILSGAGGVDFLPANLALISQTVSNAAQPNITSVGTLTTLAVSGNVATGNLNGGNLVSANFFSGDGGFLSNISVTGGVLSNGSSNITVQENSDIKFTVAGTEDVVMIDTSGVAIDGTITGSNGATLTATSDNQVIIERDNGTGLRFKGKNIAGADVQSYAGIFSNEAFGATPPTKTRLVVGSNEDMSLELQTSNEMRISAVDNNTGGGKVRIASGDGSGSPHGIEFHPGTQAEVDNLVAKIDTSGLEVDGRVIAKVFKTEPVLFSNLPDPAVVGPGARAFVLNSSTTTFGAVADGSGSNVMPVFSNGVEWLIG